MTEIGFLVPDTLSALGLAAVVRMWALLGIMIPCALGTVAVSLTISGYVSVHLAAVALLEAVTAVKELAVVVPSIDRQTT